MGRLLEENVIDAELREWITPNFSTTTRDNSIVASLIIMGTFQKYFSYSFYLLCGLPSVTLLGTEEDWANILFRLDRLKVYGTEPTTWCNLLKPIVSRFIKTFQCPDSNEMLEFWQRIAHTSPMGSGPTYISGWITAFCFWNQEGTLLYQDPGPKTRVFQEGWNGLSDPYLEFDGAAYSRVTIVSIPPGYGSVPVKIDDNGYVFDATMVAGSIEIKGTSSGKPSEDGQIGLDTMQPVSGWCMFENSADAKEEPDHN